LVPLHGVSTAVLPLLKFQPSYLHYVLSVGASQNSIVWDVAVQAGRSRVRFPTRSSDFFNLPHPSSRTIALGSTQPLTEMSTRNLPGG
jgi:hypothetical protein